MKRIITLILLIVVIFIGCTTSTAYIQNEIYDKMVEEALLKRADELNLAKGSITKEEQIEMLTYLASDELEGRRSGEQGNELAAKYIAKEFKEYGLIKGMGDSYFQEFDADLRGKGELIVKTKNVVGYLEGNDPILKNEVIIVCAHFDHVGYKNYHNNKDAGKIHNGADDNASGTVGVIELADAFSHIKDKISRTIVFIAFSAEEMGLCGSKYYVENPIFPLENTIFVCNLDMIGWLKGQETLYAKDTRSILIRAIMRNIDDNYPFKMKYENAGRSSDHYPFYQNNIPVSFITTGMEEVYHTPNDDADLIDYDGLKLITDFVFELLCLVDTIEERPVVPSNH